VRAIRSWSYRWRPNALACRMIVALSVALGCLFIQIVGLFFRFFDVPSRAQPVL
jgi:hypothetical protein